MKAQKIEQIDLKLVKPDPKNPRRITLPEHIASLAVNMGQEDIGMINPIEIDDSNMIVTGHARFAAAKVLGWKTAGFKRFTPASPARRLCRQVSENLHQGSLPGTSGMHPWDCALALQALLKAELAGELGADVRSAASGADRPPPPANDKGHERLAARLGCSADYIDKHLAPLGKGVPKVLKKAIEKSDIDLTSALAIMKAPDDYQEMVTKQVVSQNREKEETPVASAAIHEAAKALGRASDKAPEIIGFLASDVPADSVIGKIREVAPRPSDLVDEITAAGDKLMKSLGVVDVVLTQAGRLGSFPPIQRPTIATLLQDYIVMATTFLEQSDLTQLEDPDTVEGEFREVE